jgi:hypothetical protein
VSTDLEAATPDAPTESSGAGAFPWPPRPEDSVVDGLIDTWRGATLRPAGFFAVMPESGSPGAPLLYYLMIGILGAGLRLFWSMLLPRADSAVLSDLLGSAVRANPLVDFLASPLYLLLSLFLAAGVTHLLVLTLVPAHHRFGSTLRVFCFAYSPVLFGVVPYAGPVLAFVWMIVLSIVGLRVTHQTSTARAAAAVLLPLVVASLFLIIAIFLLARGAALLGVT